MKRIIQFLLRLDIHEYAAIFAILCAVIGVYGSVQQMDEGAAQVASR